MPRRPTEPVVLALDLGTSSVRTTLFDGNAKPIPHSKASQFYRVRHSADHGAELDPQVLLRATQKCLRQTRRLTKSPVSAVGGSGFWHSLLGLDRAGNPLTPIYTWGDARCTEDAARLRAILSERAVQQRTGCMLRASFWPAKLLWLRRTQPQLFGRVARWVSPAEWIFEQIFAVRACSHSMASGTGLYDFAGGDWDAELMEICRLARPQLGVLRDKVNADGPTIFPAIGDGAASNLGSGASTTGIVAINLGTSAAVRAIPSGDLPLPFGLFRFVVDQHRTLLGGAVSNAGNLRAWCLRELRLPNDERALEKILRQSGSASAGLTILPFWVSERAPTWPEHLDGVIHGLTRTSTAADLFHAATAAVFHRLAQILILLESVIGRAKKIIVSGGMVQSPASLQILANSLGRELSVCANKDASLRGAAVHALERLGKIVQPPKPGKIIRHNRANAAKARIAQARQNQLEELLSSWGR
jgi:gluconokinase